MVRGSGLLVLSALALGLAGCGTEAPTGFLLGGMHPGSRQFLSPSDDGQPMLVMGPGVPYQGCLLSAATPFDGASPGVSPCAVTMASLRAASVQVGAK